MSWDAENRYPVVDASLCNGCGLCTYVCNDDALVCRELNEGALDTNPEGAQSSNPKDKFNSDPDGVLGSNSGNTASAKEACHD